MRPNEYSNETLLVLSPKINPRKSLIKSMEEQGVNEDQWRTTRLLYNMQFCT